MPDKLIPQSFRMPEDDVDLLTTTVDEAVEVLNIPRHGLKTKIMCDGIVRECYDYRTRIAQARRFAKEGKGIVL